MQLRLLRYKEFHLVTDVKQYIPAPQLMFQTEMLKTFSVHVCLRWKFCSVRAVFSLQTSMFICNACTAWLVPCSVRDW